MQVPDPLQTTQQVADYLNFSPRTIRRMAQNKDLPAVKVSGRWRFSRKDILTFAGQGQQK